MWETGAWREEVEILKVKVFCILLWLWFISMLSENHSRKHQALKFCQPPILRLWTACLEDAMKVLYSDTQWDLVKCQIRRLSDCECLLAYFNVVTAPHKLVELERMPLYIGIGLQRFHVPCFSEVWQPVNAEVVQCERQTSNCDD